MDKEKEKKSFEEFMKNPSWESYYKEAPSKALKEYIRFTWYRSEYGEPEDADEFKKVRDAYWKKLSVEDWEYLKKTHPNSPFTKLCSEKIKELSK